MTNQLDEAKLARLTPEQLKWYHEEVEKYSGDAETTAKAIRDAGYEATAVFGDIANFRSKRIVDKAVEVYGSVDIVVNVAGAFGFAPLTRLPKSFGIRLQELNRRGILISFATPFLYEEK